MNREQRSVNGVRTYECLDCDRQVRSSTRPSTCEHCGGDLRDLARGRE